MQRLANEKDHVVENMLESYIQAKSYTEYGGSEKCVVKYADIPQGKVGLVSGGGSGHEPAFLGHTDRSMLDAVAIREVFSSPTANAFLDAFCETNHENGMACLFSNHAGDNVNVKIVKTMAEDEGIQTRYAIVNDDMSLSPKEAKEKRHRTVGGVYMWKIAGVTTVQGADFGEVCRTAEKTAKHTCSICIDLAPCTIPDVGHLNFTTQEGTYESDIGHHGGLDMDIRPIASVKEIAEETINAIHEDYELMKSDEVLITVSGLGIAPLMEQYILYKKAADQLKERRIRTHHLLVGSYVTSFDMNSAAITVLKLDEELKKLLDVPAVCTVFQFIQQYN